MELQTDEDPVPTTSHSLATTQLSVSSIKGERLSDAGVRANTVRMLADYILCGRLIADIGHQQLTGE
jgi:hypothetical protein